MDQTKFDNLITRFTTALEGALARLPADFCSGFKYTSTGMNYTHPIILAELAKIVANESDVRHVGVDVRLNWQGNESGLRSREKCRFQPDVVGFDDAFRPMIFVDYESPNSSDERIIHKDIGPYLRWREVTLHSAPYLLFTTLPEVKSPKWEVRYTSDAGYGAAAKGKKEEVQNNPFQFWKSVWRLAPEIRNLRWVAILNINCQSVCRVRFDE